MKSLILVIFEGSGDKWVNNVGWGGGKGSELGVGGWWGLGELLRVATGTLEYLSRRTVLPHKGKIKVSHFLTRSDQ
jgi:hypothetical protein